MVIKIVSGSESAGDRLYPSTACLPAGMCHPNLEKLKCRRHKEEKTSSHRQERTKSLFECCEILFAVKIKG